jgi:chemotaxis protein CheD
MLIVTVLGSCVSACLRDPGHERGRHEPLHAPVPGGRAEGTAFGIGALRRVRHGAPREPHALARARRERIQAKIFGAGRIVPGMSDVGARNADFALEYLERERIPVIAQDLGRTEASKVYFFPRSGRVLLKRLKQLPNDTVLRRERLYAEKLHTLVKAKPADLFV